jgi:hypothetical protein
MVISKCICIENEYVCVVPNGYLCIILKQSFINLLFFRFLNPYKCTKLQALKELISLLFRNILKLQLKSF